MDNTALLAEVLKLAYATKISEKLVSQQFERKPPNCGWRHFHGKLVVFMIPDTLNSWPHVVGIHSDRAVTADVEPYGSVFCFILLSELNHSHSPCMSSRKVRLDDTDHPFLLTWWPNGRMRCFKFRDEAGTVEFTSRILEDLRVFGGLVEARKGIGCPPRRGGAR